MYRSIQCIRHFGIVYADIYHDIVKVNNMFTWSKLHRVLVRQRLLQLVVFGIRHHVLERGAQGRLECGLRLGEQAGAPARLHAGKHEGHLMEPLVAVTVWGVAGAL